jgi:hypothetical protein
LERQLGVDRWETTFETLNAAADVIARARQAGIERLDSFDFGTLNDTKG